MGGVMETDAIQKCIDNICHHWGGMAAEQIQIKALDQLSTILAEVNNLNDTKKILEMTVDLNRKEAQAEIDRLKAFEPQWLPAGKLPDAEGWWMWCTQGLQVDIYMIRIQGGQVMYYDDDMRLNRVLDFAHVQDRFAPLPNWEGPKE